ncbi:hypothetical protein AB0442_07270 [Kitasatospora sp. NPDC085895]|uniref:hypothetical protein n=1 Tax=Kitasatospora sp. NPDC085895 TaxID=3155057 RepID=UPI003450620B
MTDDATAPLGELPRLVRFEHEPALRFLEHAVGEYRKCLDSRGADGTPSHLPRASGLLFGRVDDLGITVRDVEFVPNVRDSDEAVMAEFETTIAPRFGEVYRNPGRGFWSDEGAVLRAVQRQAAAGLEPMGSVHSHPDWHEIGPPHERRQRLSENPTPMDEYLFRQSCWPVNVIWYVHTADDGGLAHRVAGWRPGPERCEALRLRLPPDLCAEFGVQSSH